MLQMRFGLGNGHVYPLEKIGERLGLTRERVRQIEAQALRKLREPEVSNRLRHYLSAWTVAGIARRGSLRLRNSGLGLWPGHPQAPRPRLTCPLSA